jgi:tetratricopeptide (TPR) repeat protein
MELGNPAPRANWLIVVAPLVLTALVWGSYANSLQGPFVFDDWHVIEKNPAIRDLSNLPHFYHDLSLFSVLATNRDYRPLFMTSMTLCWWAGDGDPTPFHVVSVCVHLCAVLFLFFALRRLFEHETEHATTAALFGASLFAVHPLATEATVYVSSQSAALAACFYLLSLWLFLEVYSQRRSGPRSWALRLASWLAYALALLGKPIAFSLPLVLILWDLLIGRKLTSPPQQLSSLFLGLRKHLPYVAISVAYLLVRQAVFSVPFGGGGPVRSAFDHYLTQTEAIVLLYLRLALLPFGLNADLDYPVSTSLADGGVLIALSILAAGGYSLWRLRQHRGLVFCCLWFFSGFLLTSYGVVLIQVTNEHRAYLPLPGFCAAAALGLWKLCDALPLQIGDSKLGPRTGRILVLAMILLVIPAFAWATRARNEVWSSKLTLWEDAALNGGTWRAHMNYALALESAGRGDEALREFHRAVEIGPYAFAFLNLGLAQIRRDDNQAGLKNLRHAASLFPESPDTHLHLGIGLQTCGHLKEAEEALRKALQMRPESLRARQELATLYEKQQDYCAALPLLQDLDRMEDDQADLLFRLAFAYWKVGEVEPSLRAYERLVAVNPEHVQGTFNLAYALGGSEHREDWQRSLQLFEKTLLLKPEYTECWYHMAQLCRKLGLAEDADDYQQRYDSAQEAP